jgi:hypothetical protein
MGRRLFVRVTGITALSAGPLRPAHAADSASAGHPGLAGQG